MRVKDCKEDLDMILAIEGDVLLVEDMEDLNRVKELAKGLSRSQGFYGRLLLQLSDIIEEGLPIQL